MSSVSGVSSIAAILRELNDPSADKQDLTDLYNQLAADLANIQKSMGDPDQLSAAVQKFQQDFKDATTEIEALKQKYPSKSDLLNDMEKSLNDCNDKVNTIVTISKRQQAESDTSKQQQIESQAQQDEAKQQAIEQQASDILHDPSSTAAQKAAAQNDYNQAEKQWNADNSTIDKASDAIQTDTQTIQNLNDQILASTGQIPATHDDEVNLQNQLLSGAGNDNNHFMDDINKW